MQQNRRTGTRRHTAGGGFGWRQVLIGFVLGLGVMWAAQHLLDGGRFTGLRKLFRHHPAPQTAVAPPAVPTAPPKPTFDFYTILPEVGSGPPRTATQAGRAGGGNATTGGGIRYILQAAAYVRSHDADHLRAELAMHGVESYTEKVSIEGHGAYYRVRLGPFDSLAAMRAVDRRLARLGIKAIPLKVKAAPRT